MLATVIGLGISTSAAAGTNPNSGYTPPTATATCKIGGNGIVKWNHMPLEVTASSGRFPGKWPVELRTGYSWFTTISSPNGANTTRITSSSGEFQSTAQTSAQVGGNPGTPVYFIATFQSLDGSVRPVHQMVVQCLP